MKTALVTGASGGIGLEIARLFAKDGNNLLLISRSEDKLLNIKQEIEQQYSVTVNYLSLDLSKTESVQIIENYVEHNGLHIEYLVNNAGFGDFGRFVERDVQKYHEMIALNIVTVMELTQRYAQKMLKQGHGQILNVASIAALQPVPLMAVYGATKAFVLSFSEAIRQELRNTGVTVTTLLPGPAATNFFNRAEANNVPLFRFMMSPAKVALDGYKAMLKGKRRAIPGFLNKCLAFVVRVLPGGFVLNMAVKLMDK
ncbi:MAG: SDR family oxidoreductase [Lentimicrobiaceae bacterium]|jgi:short-subunit dehydrogenase|nr:SDR family oxidoreductase [Lentimicrobiaceae bacterium]